MPLKITIVKKTRDMNGVRDSKKIRRGEKIGALY
jgi:hypothetical protein